MGTELLHVEGTYEKEIWPDDFMLMRSDLWISQFHRNGMKLSFHINGKGGMDYIQLNREQIEEIAKTLNSWLSENP